MLAGVDPTVTPLGDYADAVWAAYVEHARSTTPEQGEALDEAWSKLTAPLAAVPTTPTAPTAPAQAATPPAPAVADAPPDGTRRPTKAERDAWAIRMAQTAGPNPLMAEAERGKQAAPKVGGR